MRQPPGYYKWRFHWFHCPFCGFRAYDAVAKFDIPADRRRARILFRCQSCDRLCTLKHPRLNGGVLLVLFGPFLFAITFGLLDALLPVGWGAFRLISCAIGAAVVASSAVIALGRLTQRYVSTE